MEEVLGFTMPVAQSMHGLDALADGVLARFPRAGWEFREAVRRDLYERRVLKLFGHLGSVMPTAEVALGGGYGDAVAGMVGRMGLRGLRRVGGAGAEAVGLDLENVRTPYRVPAGGGSSGANQGLLFPFWAGYDGKHTAVQGGARARLAVGDESARETSALQAGQGLDYKAYADSVL